MEKNIQMFQTTKQINKTPPKIRDGSYKKNMGWTDELRWHEISLGRTTMRIQQYSTTTGFHMISPTVNPRYREYTKRLITGI